MVPLFTGNGAYLQHASPPLQPYFYQCLVPKGTKALKLVLPLIHMSHPEFLGRVVEFTT
jgi:hypothetical protein